MNGIRRCVNNLCGKFIYDYQSQSKFCDDDCKDEAHRWESLTNTKPKALKQNFDSVYPHRYLPINLIINES